MFFERLKKGLKRKRKYCFGRDNRDYAVLSSYLSDEIIQCFKRNITIISEKFFDEYREFYKEFFSPVIKGAQNKFRQDLFGELQKADVNIFYNSVNEYFSVILKELELSRIKGSGNFELNLSETEIALPIGTRFVFQKKNAILYCIEQIPQMRTVFFRDLGKFQLVFPFIVFLVLVIDNQVCNLFLFFRNNPLRSRENELFCPALPNVSSNYAVCFPRSQARSNLTDTIEEAIIDFWGSGFNYDYSQFIMSMAGGEIPTSVGPFLRKWQEDSKKDYLSVLKQKWQPTGKSLREMAAMIFRSVLPQVNNNQNEYALQNFSPRILQLSQEVARKIQETTFFLVPHLVIEDKGLPLVESQLQGLIKDKMILLKEYCEQELTRVFSRNNINRYIDEIVIKRREAGQ